MGRPFLFSNIRSVNQTPSQKMSASRSKLRAILVSDCVEAALEIVDLCRLLRDETGLARASYTEFSSCRAALLVILAQSLTKRTERLRNSLSQGMGLIKIMSMGIGSAKSAVNVIEALERAIRRLEDWSESQAYTKDHRDSIDSGYERFKSWEMLWKTGPISPVTGTSVSTRTNQLHPQDAAAMQYLQSPPSIQLPNSITNDLSEPNSTEGVTAPNPTPATVNNQIPRSANGKMIENIHHDSNDTDNNKDKNSQTTNEVLFNQLGVAHLPDASDLPPTPNFGFEGFISNFPQELDEFAAISCFDNDFLAQGGSTGGASFENIQGRASRNNAWLT
jgi:hypothetical protein